MKKVTIKNLQNVQTHGATFNDDTKMQQWIDNCKANHSWGKPAGAYSLRLLSEAELATEISRTEPSIEFPLLGVMVTIPDQFSITIEDITTEENLNKLRELRKEKLARLDQLVNIAFLNSWTAAEKTELKDYRNALLNITEPYKTGTLLNDLNDVVWPTEPTEV